MNEVMMHYYHYLRQNSTYHLPFKISSLIIAELTEARVKGTMTLAFVTGIEFDVINGDVASVSSGLVLFRLGDGFKQQLKYLKSEIFLKNISAEYFTVCSSGYVYNTWASFQYSRVSSIRVAKTTSLLKFGVSGSESRLTG